MYAVAENSVSRVMSSKIVVNVLEPVEEVRLICILLVVILPVSSYWVPCDGLSSFQCSGNTPCLYMPGTL